MTARAVLAGTGLLISGALMAAAAEDAPTTRPASGDAEALAPRTATHLLEIELLELQLALEGAYDRRDTRFSSNDLWRGNARQTNRSYRFQELVGLQTRGSIFDKKWLVFDAALEGGFDQQWYSESGTVRDRADRPNGTLFTYDFDATLFPRGKLSATAFAKRSDTRVPRAFQSSLERNLERYGAELNFSSAKFPMRMTYEHVRDELYGRTGVSLDNERRGRDRLQYEATWQISQWQALRLDYEYDDRRERYAGTRTQFDTRRHYLRLNHKLRFGEDHRSLLETTGRIQDETGEIGRDLSEWMTRLRWQLNKQLAANWSAQYLRDGFQGLDTETWRGEGGLTYDFSDALRSMVQMYGLTQQASENADFNEWGGLASATYAQKNQWGQLTANLSYNFNATGTSSGTRRGIVIAESVTLRDPLPAILVHSEVDPASIVVTDAGRTRVYLPTRDYVVVRTGAYTALRRVLTGEIANRQTVLVSYTYRVSSNYDLTRHRVDFRLQQAFDFGLTPYYAASIQNEDLNNARFQSFRARNVNRHRIGATYRRPRWSVGTEYEYNDEAIDPYRALHANGDVVLFRNARNEVDGKLSLSRFWFDGSEHLESRNTTLLDLGVSYRGLLARDLEFNAAALYRFEDDSLYGVTHGVDLSSAVDWQIGLFTLRFEAEYDVLNLPGSDDDNVSFWLKLVRRVPVIARRDS